MEIIQHTRYPVKPPMAGRPRREPSPFGAGLAAGPGNPVDPAPVSDAERAAAVLSFEAWRARQERAVEVWADVARTVERMASGWRW